MKLEAGTIVAGKFRLVRPLAQGGMGSVWVAFNQQLEVPVAVKFMAPALVGSRDLVVRFEREAKAAAQLRHPNVVQIFEHGVVNGTPFMAMELLEGEDLTSRIKARGRLSLSETAAILGEVCRALRKAHEKGIVHRDLKPANVFLVKHDDFENVKVLDFGIAKVASTGEDGVTQTGEIIGSPHYMAPEQARRGATSVDHRSDLWSVGVIAFRCLTGRPPFLGDNALDVLMVVCDPKADAPAPSSIAPDLGPEVDRFFERALCRDPNGRFQSAKEMADALNRLAGGETSSSHGIQVAAIRGAMASLPEIGPPAADDDIETLAAKVGLIPDLLVEAPVRPRTLDPGTFSPHLVASPRAAALLPPSSLPVVPRGPVPTPSAGLALTPRSPFATPPEGLPSTRPSAPPEASPGPSGNAPAEVPATDPFDVATTVPIEMRSPLRDAPALGGWKPSKTKLGSQTLPLDQPSLASQIQKGAAEIAAKNRRAGNTTAPLGPVAAAFAHSSAPLSVPAPSSLAAQSTAYSSAVTQITEAERAVLTATAASRPPSPKSRSLIPLAATAAVVVVVGVIGGVLHSAGSSASAEPEAAPLVPATATSTTAAATTFSPTAPATAPPTAPATATATATTSKAPAPGETATATPAVPPGAVATPTASTKATAKPTASGTAKAGSVYLNPSTKDWDTPAKP